MTRLALVCVLVGACSTRSTYTCTASDQCVEMGAHGTCQPQGFCSFPDMTCPSGQRFEANAGDGLGGQCATALPIDAPMIDAPRDGVPPEPIAFVQQTAAVIATGAMQSITLPAPVAAHHAVIACVDYYGDGDAQVTDSLGNSYALAAGPFTAFGLRSYVFVAFDSPAGMDTITYTLSAAATNDFEIYVHEYAGLAAVDASATASGSSAATDGMTSGAADTHAGNELIFGFGVSLSGGAAAGTGFTIRSSFHSNVTEDQVTTTAGTYEATATMTSGMYWTMMMATFR